MGVLVTSMRKIHSSRLKYDWSGDFSAQTYPSWSAATLTCHTRSVNAGVPQPLCLYPGMLTVHKASERTSFVTLFNVFGPVVFLA